MTYFGMKDRFNDEPEEQNKQPTHSDYVSMPSNDDDIDGIKNYIGWHMYKAGMSSTVLHYLDVLYQRAK